MKVPFRAPWPLGAVLLSAAMLALLQQQWLLRRPPRLESLGAAAASAGSAALEARFSRPMALKSLQQASRLDPPRPHRWLGEGERLQLTLLDQKPVRQPLQLALAGHDRRGQALRPSLWHWDPRPRLLAVVPMATGEQLQLRDHDGRWLPLSPVWPRLQSVEPQGRLLAWHMQQPFADWVELRGRCLPGPLICERPPHPSQWFLIPAGLIRQLAG